MAILISLSETSWRQPLADRERDFRLFNVHRDVARHCAIFDQQRRLMSVTFAEGQRLEQCLFTITSGVEMRMSAASQGVIAEYKRRHRTSYYDVEVLDVSKPAIADDICFDVDGDYMEGGTRRVRHYNLERNPKASRDKKAAFKKQHGRLFCEVCGFGFSDMYVGADEFIECHHLLPLHRLAAATVIRLDDLALLCSNCHRVAHIHLRRESGALSVAELQRAILRQQTQDGRSR